ncbi:MFS transporter [Legionella quateirensis]|uniref:MFS transporter n=1 Tax=Legionella quateirensis TaxID=45072 RepID=A0A378KY07_9GAMM|nr:MFS transporter [Legionella quateirensis]KTD43366.1 MFS transporter [Legionella quateirensis]STY18248.1 MFS transporter [Legionella quateirensis]
MSNSNNSLKTIAAICIGNAMEWYDFMIFNFMLLFIAHAYFPNQNRITSLLATMASSGVALVVRPLGGVLLGIWADKHGHHKALMLVFNLMAFATILITFTPSFAHIGIWATVLIVGARLIQGMATGAEFGIASSLLNQMAPEDKKGLYTSFQMVGQLLAVLFGSSICFFLTLTCSKEFLYDYAWRFPFAIGLFILPIGWLLRRQLQRQNIWTPKKARPLSLSSMIMQQKRLLVIGLCLVIGCTGSVYTLFSYMPTFSKLYLHLSMTEAYLGPMIGILISIITIPLFGALSDRVGKKPILLSSLVFYISLIYPLLSLLNQHPALSTLILVESILGVFIGAYFGVMTALLSELFPVLIRSTCLAISYNLAVMLFGGFAPFIITALIEKTHNPMIFTYYLMTAVTISLCAALAYQEPDKSEVMHSDQLVTI